MFPCKGKYRTVSRSPFLSVPTGELRPVLLLSCPPTEEGGVRKPLQSLPLQSLPLQFLPLQFFPLQFFPLQFFPLQFPCKGKNCKGKDRRQGESTDRKGDIRPLHVFPHTVSPGLPVGTGCSAESLRSSPLVRPLRDTEKRRGQTTFALLRGFARVRTTTFPQGGTQNPDPLGTKKKAFRRRINNEVVNQGTKLRGDRNRRGKTLLFPVHVVSPITLGVLSSPRGKLCFSP